MTTINLVFNNNGLANLLSRVQVNQYKLRVSEPSQTVQFKAYHCRNVGTFQNDTTQKWAVCEAPERLG